MKPKRKPFLQYYAGIGSRETPDDVLEEMRRFAATFRKMDLILRSGGAVGADSAFEREAGMKKEIFIPDYVFNNRVADDVFIVAPSRIETGRLIETARKFHPAWHKCSEYAKRLHARNVAIVLGLEENKPVKFVLCWTQNGKATGGTGMGIRIAWNKGIPVINLKTEPGNKEQRHRQVVSKVQRILNIKSKIFAAV